jgi:hypothetical protein
MNPQTNEESTGMPSSYDPFQEIRTMPKGWNLSSLLETRPAAEKTASSQAKFDPDDNADPDTLSEDLP